MNECRNARLCGEEMKEKETNSKQTLTVYSLSHLARPTCLKSPRLPQGKREMHSLIGWVFASACCVLALLYALRSISEQNKVPVLLELAVGCRARAAVSPSCDSQELIAQTPPPWGTEAWELGAFSKSGAEWRLVPRAMATFSR